MEINTSSLTGHDLNLAVSLVLKIPLKDRHGYCPSENWAQGGIIIEREKIDIRSVGISTWRADITSSNGTYLWSDGPSPLVAAMRCFLRLKIDGAVNFPDEFFLAEETVY